LWGRAGRGNTDVHAEDRALAQSQEGPLRTGDPPRLSLGGGDRPCAAVREPELNDERLGDESPSLDEGMEYEADTQH
jgi:hypothetical protein